MDNIQSYKCPCCGAALEFSPSLGKLGCESCGNEFELDVLKQIKDAQDGVHESNYDWEHYEPREFGNQETKGISGYTCPSCGAEITGDDTLSATVCPYCSNATIIKSQFEGTLKPDFVIPFKKDKKMAMEEFEKACKKAPFLPDEFKDKKRISEMSGVYVPFWMFDCDCTADVTYNAQRIFRWSDSNYDYTRTDFFHIFRSGNVGYENIPVDGSKKADDNYMEALEPFDYTDAKNFDTAFLSGFLADRYDVSAEESIERANERVKNSTISAFGETVCGYINVVPVNCGVNFSRGKIRYSLLPVWMLNIKYLDKIYKFAINGQTGKVVGEYPVCKKKRNRFFYKVFGISLTIALVIGWLYLS